MLGFLDTNGLIALGTLAGAVGALIGVYLTYREVRRSVDIRLAERAKDLMALLLDIERIAVEQPHLAAYFQREKPLPPEEGELRDQILAYALLYVDFAETVGWQIRADQMTRGSALDWRYFLRDLHRRMPAIRHVLERDCWMLAGETRWLFGTGRTPATLKRLGFEEDLELRDLRERRDDDLLAALHETLFVPSFPDPDEQESPADWGYRLWGDPAPPHPEQHATLAGIDIDLPDQRVLAGFAFVERYRESACGLLSYIAVDASWRRQKLGAELLRVRAGIRKTRGRP